MDEIVMRPIGRVQGGRRAAIDDAWGVERCRVVLDQAVLDPEATAGLEDFSHAEVVFLFDGVDPDAVCRGRRHPRGNADWPSVGILAQRAKDRPNRIGTTVCQVLAVGPGWVDVAGLDAIDGTPVLDVKPYLTGFAPRGEVREPAWSGELMADYW